MPLRHQPDTLQKNAMRSIAMNFDYICYRAESKAEMAKMVSDDTYLNVEGPFKHLPGVLCQGIIDVIKRTCSRVRREHLWLLLQESVTEFTMTDIGPRRIAWDFIMQKCPRLRRLDVAYLRSVGPGTIMRLIPNLKHIVVLNLSMTETIDQVLELIGLNCPEIRELDISHTAISERGLPKLCYDAANDRPLCQKLTKISIMGCIITPRPVSFLLQYIPTLREMDYDNIFQVFNVMKEWGLTPANIGTCEKLHLRLLTSTNEAVDPEDVDIAIELCPYATNFTLSHAYVENDVLYKIMRMENLTHLRITNSEGLTLDFHEGVLPVLTVKGHQLHSLLLVNFTTVDVAAIGECCPRLQNLALSNIGVYEEIMYPREQYFCDLRSLEIWSALTSETMNSTILRQLLTYCHHLQNLLIKATDAISDKLLYDIWRENEMKQLSRLTIDTCPNVTAEAIHQLLDMTNNLTLIRLWGCFFITKNDEAKLQKRIKDENCDVYLEWYCWEG
ncbi:uncharacterized protein LOC134778128 isoform X3 [Penaeus indicus]|uniref:uncharacterized protein LOC134778128 isoform X3 n=1 Tax=Penaeus indicus TaxID=29960 RepID=UPI00300C0FCA